LSASGPERGGRPLIRRVSRVRPRRQLDVHARELTPLGVLFAATRSLAEAEVARQRSDEQTV
jgi:hypothetical protein